jgi:hypothetical protein
MISETPVQFLPAYNPLAEEAVVEAVTHEYEGVSVRVVSPEHLIALALQTGGKHRLVRTDALFGEQAVDFKKLASILTAHNIKNDLTRQPNG